MCASLFEVDITTNSLAQINSKLNLNLCDYLLIIIQTRKNHVEVSDISWSHFLHLKKLFFKVSVRDFCHVYMTSLAYNISDFLSANHNPELWFVICTGVVLTCTHHPFYGFSAQGMVASWLPHWVVWNMGVQTLVGDIVICYWARYLTQCSSP